jgi:uncharacterized protein (TIGR00369 family)
MSTSRPTLTDAEQQRLRTWFRDHVQRGVRFNVLIGVEVTRWDDEAVCFHLAFADDLSAHDGVFHGGVVAALIDTCGTAAVMAGHDYARGSRFTTVSLNVNFLSVAPEEGVVAEGTCTRRGRINYTEVKVWSDRSRRLVAQGLVVVNVAGVKRGLERSLETDG